jgi:hypothetical protein
MIARDDTKQGRNELCDCGSGEKYKKCCGTPVKKDLTLRDMMKCLYLLLEGASQSPLGIPQGPIPFSKKSLADVPDDIINRIMVADNADFIVLTVKPTQPESPIIQLDKEIALPPCRVPRLRKN